MTVPTLPKDRETRRAGSKPMGELSRVEPTSARAVSEEALPPRSGSMIGNRNRATRRRRAGAALIACSAVGVSFAYVPAMQGAFGAALALLMLAIAFIDARRLIIPDELSAGAFVLALLHAWTFAPSRDFGALVDVIAAPTIRAAVLGLSLFSLRLGYRRLRGREGLGLGDVKLGCVAGAWLGWTMMPVAIEIAALAALAFYSLRQLRQDHESRLAAKLPFGAFFAPTIWLCWLLQETLLN